MSIEEYDAQVTEAQFQKAVVDLARGLGWLVMHLPIITTPRKTALRQPRLSRPGAGPRRRGAHLGT